MNHSHQLCCLAIAMVLLSLPVAADEPESKSAADRQALFTSLDANKDGQLAADEVAADKKGLFDRLVRLADKNGDGKLSSEEFAAGLADKPAETAKKAPDTTESPEHPEKKPNGERLFKRLDANSDGLLTLNEVPEERRRMVFVVLKRLKKDNDAGLTRDEFVRVIEGRLDGEPRPGKPPRPERPPVAGPPRGGLFLLFDADRDGKLSSGEISAAAEVLKKLDRDGDGSVTLEELMAAAPRPGGDN